LAYINTIKSIAIGSFDGIHLAHQQLIKRVDALVIIERNGGYLTPGYKRTHYTDKACYFYHFEKVRALTPEAFVEKLCSDFPNLEKIVVGYDFHFGKEKAGNAALLSSLFSKEVEIVNEVKIEGISIHSRTIKNYLKEGNVMMANRLLGRTYEIDGFVVPGQGLGAKELVPTINVNVRQYQLPLEGVYATSTKIEGVWYDSVSFLGHRVTTDGSFAVESHILDRDIRELGEEITIVFQRRIRANQKFDTLEALKRQIVLDMEEARSKK
jgi:riboflavin kinase/FMN adenylyltransferase